MSVSQSSPITKPSRWSHLPKPDCTLGYTRDQLTQILGDRLPEFYKFMTGQTVALCEGRRYNYETKEYEADGCGPHGVATYRCDVIAFLEGREPLD